MKKLGMVIHKAFPPDIRVEKEAKTLMNAGYKVFLLCNRNPSEKESEIIEHINVSRITPITEISVLRRKLIRLRYYLTLMDDHWLEQIDRFVKDNDLDALHIHDLPLLKPGLAVAERRGIPLVADLHENYPYALQIYMQDLKGFKENIVSIFRDNHKRWVRYERKDLNKADKIIVVIDEAKERILKYGIPPEKIEIVSNTVDIAQFEEYDKNYSIMDSHHEVFIVLYVGGFGKHRGLEVAIEAMRFLEKINDIKLMLVGWRREKKLTYYSNIVKEYGLENKVELIEWQPLQKVPGFIKISDCCLIPHVKNPQTDSTIPHKLFQYMLYGKPVIVSDCKPLKRIVDTTNCGLVFNSGEVKGLANSIKKLYLDSQLRVEFGERGKKAVQKKYNWQNDSARLIKLYQDLL